MNLNELALENIGSWPLLAKNIVLASLCLLIGALFYFFDIQPYQLKVKEAIAENADLRTAYEAKFVQSQNLPEYRAQVVQINRLINSKLAELPQNIDVPDLIDDISKTGNASNLAFKEIKPQSEVEKDFYTALPIQITVTGHYHQFGEFVSHLANLQRIVTLEDFTIQPAENTMNMNQSAADLSSTTGLLSMSLIANTYKQTMAFQHQKTPSQSNAVNTGVNHGKG